MGWPTHSTVVKRPIQRPIRLAFSTRGSLRRGSCRAVIRRQRSWHEMRMGAMLEAEARTETLIHTYIHTYIHAYIHTYIHTYIYIYIYCRSSLNFAALSIPALSRALRWQDLNSAVRGFADAFGLGFRVQGFADAFGLMAFQLFTYMTADFCDGTLGVEGLGLWAYG